MRISPQEIKMSNRRRHAHDFTDSLTSFRQVISDKKSSPAKFQAPLEKRLNYIRSKQDGDAKCNCLKNNKFRRSIILAGSLASQQCTSLSDSCNIAKKNYNADNNSQLLSGDAWNVSDETSYLSIKPDLNKCINLFHNEHLNEEYNSLAEQLNTTLSETTSSENSILHLSRNMGQQNINNKHSRSMSADSLKNIILLDQELIKRSKSYTMLDRILKRDTNYNIKADQLSFSSKIAMILDRNEKETLVSSFNSLSLLKPSALSNRKEDSYCVEDNQMHNSISSEKSSKEELNPSELKTFLHLLADQNPLKETTMQQQLLRRLSANCYDSPQVFTERLLTIIEESVINNSLQYPEVSLRRFNEEVRKMCKFIEDETVPEWPQSPGMSTPMYAKRKNQELKSNLSWKCLAFETPDKDLIPVSPRCNIKSPKKLCRRMSKNASYTTKNLHDSTNTFENLEAFCEKLYPNEYRVSLAKEKNQLQSPLRNMNNIRRACESQMASLEDSFNIYEEIRKAGIRISDSANQYNTTPEMQDLQHRLMSYDRYDRTDSKRVSDTFKRTKRSKHHEMIELDDFESTLMYEIAKKRQRCLDTAKTMMEIDANLESTETVEEAYPNIVINESSPTTNDDKFMKILMCVKKYQDYLEEHKSLLNLLHQTRPSSPHDRKDARVEKNENHFSTCAPLVLLGNKPTSRTPKFSPRKKSISPSASKHRLTSKTVVSKPQLFLTPGKTCSVKKSCRSKRTYFPNLLPGQNKQDEPNINPHAKNVYRQIGSYDHVISPVGMYIKGKESYLKIKPKTDEKLLIPKRKKSTRSPSPKPKFRLSLERSKEKIGTIIGDRNVDDNFLHSKVHGKLLSHVHMIKETENGKVGTRENELCSTQGYTKSAQTDHLE